MMNQFENEKLSLEAAYNKTMTELDDSIKDIEVAQKENAELSDSIKKALEEKDNLIKEKKELEAQLAQKIEELEAQSEEPNSENINEFSNEKLNFQVASDEKIKEFETRLEKEIKKNNDQKKN